MTGCSLNEIEAVLTKAARGNGADAAQAAGFARAGVMCLCTGNDVGLINAALTALPSGVIVEYAVKIQSGLVKAVDKKATLQPINALEVGYITTLPYKTERKADANWVVYLDVFEKPNKPARLDIDPDDLAHWQMLAAKTYVPESAQSRLAGAGAGLTDND